MFDKVRLYDLESEVYEQIEKNKEKPRTRKRNLHKKNKRKQKQRQKQFIALTAIIFVILFIFSIGIATIVTSAGTVDVFDGEIQMNSSSQENGSSMIIHTATLDVEEIENLTEKTERTIEPIAEEVTEPTEEIKDYTDDDLYYLAAAVCREAGGESEEIQLLVANVIINRVNSSIYPNTIYEVLTEYMQYGTMWKYGVSFPDWADDKVKEQCYFVAKRILDGERFCPENVLFQAEFEQGSGVFKQFGDDYYFCYYG